MQHQTDAFGVDVTEYRELVADESNDLFDQGRVCSHKYFRRARTSKRVLKDFDPMAESQCYGIDQYFKVKNKLLETINW